MKTALRTITVLLVIQLMFSMVTVAFAGSSELILTTNVPATVTYDANGGSGTMAAVDVAVGTDYILPRCGFAAPRGRTFRCWQIDMRTLDPGDTITVTTDITVRALWKSSGTGSASSIANRIQQLLQPVIQIIRNIFSRWF